ncbi:sulfite exporter TauE/SafE family protein [[Clostridium] bifermentans ATCC 638]|uniref:Probable membrane transporter protein n=1 Tax=Paraclostridium bifermentans ATCC 638 = DSM 14991 TaxID=1233171 RepID=T4VC80_PARBF|nr:sulfite exporter TauE/SafE family protein [Paraclostridium bifermentans]EQK41324.1 sulfite exporter TauE/SafE family protein [[Clostridium] bifermentans ATCC 638] [Paraclostridium bifermentans ATCC 638 = DSM 14991]RIZ59011.1 anion permease [Paraclostridium bifermentans]UAG18469.1 sulfite exporter TauE/SafE family protein [Paraclostridium bifermentans]
MLNLIRVLLAAFVSLFGFNFIKDLSKAKSSNGFEDVPAWKPLATGFVTDFFDTLGIGSFAPTVAMMNALKINIPDKLIPGTLNVCHTIPVVFEAFIFTTVIKVDSITLISLLGAAVVGSYVGAGIISKMDERKIQIVMGFALVVTAILMLLAQLGLMPGGGNATGLTGAKLVIGVVGNFILGALMTAGVGLYSPCMAMVYFLGMSPTVAFPIMMGSCALLMPTASVKFIKEGTYAKKTSLFITIGGVIGVFIAANFVSSMPMDILRWVVIIVIAYTSVTMLKKAFTKQTA